MVKHDQEAGHCSPPSVSACAAEAPGCYWTSVVPVAPSWCHPSLVSAPTHSPSSPSADLGLSLVMMMGLAETPTNPSSTDREGAASSWDWAAQVGSPSCPDSAVLAVDSNFHSQA